MRNPTISTVDKTGGNNQERRKHSRFIKRLTVKFIIDRESFNSISSDFSESGLFLRTNRGSNVNSLIDIELLLPDNKVSFLKGIVKRTVRTPLSGMKNGMGIEIIEKDDSFMHFVKSLHGNSTENSSAPEVQMLNGTLSEMPLHRGTNTWQERRRFRRSTAELREIRGKMALATYLKIIDISAGGISFEADRRLNMGREYSLAIMYNEHVLNLRGVVVWSIICKSKEDDKGHVVPLYKAGMQFKDISEEQVQEFIDFMEQSTKIQHSLSPPHNEYIDLSRYFNNELKMSAE